MKKFHLNLLLLAMALLLPGAVAMSAPVEPRATPRPTPTPTPLPLGVRITTPRPLSSQTSLPIVSGTASPGRGQRLVRVTVTIRRSSDTTYWNGSAWVSSPVELPTVLSGNNWFMTSRLPPARELLQGAYKLTATVTNSAGQKVSSNIDVFLGVADVTPTTVTIRTPSASANLSAFPSVNGTAADNSGGSGLAEVTVNIQRNRDGAFWNGTRWVTSRTFLPTTLSNPSGGTVDAFQTVNWSLSTSLPTAADLQDGPYQILARATDVTGNFSGASVFIRIDTSNPTLAITSPTTGVVNSISLITGTAEDGPTGSGVSSINLTIRRGSDNSYWNGSSWSPNPTNLPVTLSGTNWSYRANFPAGSLTESQYFVQAVAFDRVGNSSLPEVVTLTIERTAPTVTFTAPDPETPAANNFPFIEGQANDSFSGSGVDRVELTIRRNRDNAYYNGTTFTNRLTTLRAAFSGLGFSLRTGFNTTNLEQGQYTVTATAVDRAGNRGSRTIVINVDRTAPASVTFTSPREGDLLGSFPAVNGTASDNTGGSGIQAVNLTIQRVKDGLFWSGSSWGPQVILKTKVTGTTGTVTWSAASSLPSGGNLVDSDYILAATALDFVGNSRRTSVRITINRLIGSSVANRSRAIIAPSRVSAQAVTSSIKLSFTTALDANSASDAANYQVEVNGRVVAVESVSYNSKAQTVVISLSEGSLNAGDTISVQWQNLENGQSSTLSGAASTTAQ